VAEAPPPSDNKPPAPPAQAPSADEPPAATAVPTSAADAATVGKPPLGAEATTSTTAAAKATATAAAGAAKPASAADAATAGKPAAAKAAAHPPVAAPPSGPTDPPPPAGVEPPAFIASLQAAIPGSVSQISYFVGDWTIIVPVAQIAAVTRHLRDAPDAAFDFCSDVTASDWPPRKEARFDVVYCLYSTRLRHRIRVKVRVAENQPIPSATPVWPAADWLEREVWDLFGVNFTGHPDRRRILMPEDWQGFPQRKDYPLEGPGELLMENPIDWLKLRQARDEADIE
jgi:NADH-quinone oxidoreductase subunit C